MSSYFFHDCNQPKNLQDDYILLNQRHDLRGLFIVTLMRKFTVAYDHWEGLGYFASFTSLLDERKRHLTDANFTIHPFSNFRNCWEIVMIIIYTHLFFISNFAIAFGLITNNDNYDLLFQFICHIDLLVFFFLIMDIVINFYTAFPVKYEKIIELKSKVIKRAYLSSYFIFDLYCLNPLHLLMYFELVDLPNWIYLFSLLRIFRIVTYVNYIDRLSIRIGLNHVGRLYCQYLLSLLVVIMTVSYTRWSACFLFEDRSDTKGFISMKHLGTIFTDESLWFQLFLNSYYCSSFFTFHATQSGEEIITGTWLNSITKTVLCFSGSLTSVFIFISLANIHLLNFKSQVHRHNLMQEAYAYARVSSLPESIRRRLITYYNFTYDGCYWKQHKEITSLTGQVKQEIFDFTCRIIMDEVSFVKQIPARIKFMLLEILRLEIFLINEIILDKGELCKGLYLIRYGIVAFFYGHKELCHISTGGYFGDYHLFDNEDNKNELEFSIHALDNCELYLLQKNDFEEILMKFPDLHKLIKDYKEKSLTLSDYINGIISQKNSSSINFIA